MYSDSHVHLYDIFSASSFAPTLVPGSVLCASAHGEAEFVWQESFARMWPDQVKLSFGIHPQEPSVAHASQLISLVEEGRVHAVGECGFDLYTPAYRARLEDQKSCWDMQLDIAERSGLPLVVHCRKALDLVFKDTRRLKRLKAVVFHGWPGSAREAESFLERGVNAFFSCGKGLLRGDRSLQATVRALPADRLLTETDAPWMTLKGESISIPADIRAVTAAAAELKEMERDAFGLAVYKNFIAVFGSFS